MIEFINDQRPQVNSSLSTGYMQPAFFRLYLAGPSFDTFDMDREEYVFDHDTPLIWVLGA